MVPSFESGPPFRSIWLSLPPGLMRHLRNRILACMPVPPVVPLTLRAGPFTVAQAMAAGLTRGRLRSSSYIRLGPGLYRWVGLSDGPLVKLSAMARRMPIGAAFSGSTAAWLHGLDIKPGEPIEVTIPASLGCGVRAGVSVRYRALAPNEIVIRRGLPTTSALRTAIDLGGRDPLTEAVVAVDQFLHSALVRASELSSYVDEHPGAKGVARLRRALSLAESKSESAMETRLRLILVLSGLPRPEVQVPIRDHEGRWLGRPDLLYSDHSLAIEYDGGTHRDRLVEDNRRQNGLIGAGYRLLRFTAADVYGKPELVVMQVRHALSTTVKLSRRRGKARSTSLASH